MSDIAFVRYMARQTAKGINERFSKGDHNHVNFLKMLRDIPDVLVSALHSDYGQTGYLDRHIMACAIDEKRQVFLQEPEKLPLAVIEFCRDDIFKDEIAALG